jgi:hypothetical protein
MASNKIDRKRLTQSPRELRSSTNDPEAHAKGSVQTTQEDPKKDTGFPGEPDPFRHQREGWDNKYA